MNGTLTKPKIVEYEFWEIEGFSTLHRMERPGKLW